MIGFILALVAYILLGLLSPIGIIWSLISQPKKYFFKIAISLDQLGNVVCGVPMNYLLIFSSSKHKFGYSDETISSVLGKNQINKTLKPMGRFFVNILGKLETDHSIQSIEKDEGLM